MRSSRPVWLILGGVLAACGSPSATPVADAPAATADAGPAADARIVDDGNTDYMFDLTVVRELRLEIPPASLAAIDAEAVPGEPTCRIKPIYERSYYTGSLIFEGRRFDGVGLRVKGGCGTSRHLDQKASFLVNLEWDDPAVDGCPAKRRLHGLKHLTINNLVQDSTYLHETLGYGLYRQMGVPAPRTSYLRVYVNDTYYGLYLLLETIDRPFLGRWYDDGPDDNEGMMYENGVPYCDLVPSNVDPGVDNDGGCFTREFVDSACHPPDPTEDPRDFSLLTELTHQLQAMPTGTGFLAAFSQVFDAPSYMKTWAVSSVIAHLDSYQVGATNNFRVFHHQASDRWVLIQAGLDYSMWTYNPQILFDQGVVISQKCLAEPACAAAYVAEVRAAAALISAPSFTDEAMRIHELIWPLQQTDPRREPYGDDQSYLSDYQQLVAWLPTRQAAVEAELTSNGF